MGKPSSAELQEAAARLLGAEPTTIFRWAVERQHGVAGHAAAALLLVMMMMKQIAKGMLLVVMAAGLGACGDPVAPANPTWERDVYPLVLARCVRCHDTTGHSDPLVTSPFAMKAALSHFNYPRLQDLMQDPLGYPFFMMAPKFVRGESPGAIMPPAPAEKLEQWQIDMIVNWLKNPPQ